MATDPLPVGMHEFWPAPWEAEWIRSIGCESIAAMSDALIECEAIDTDATCNCCEGTASWALRLGTKWNTQVIRLCHDCLEQVATVVTG